MINRLSRAAYVGLVRQWWWMALLSLATTITFFATGHRWWALGWAAGYIVYFALNVKVARIDRLIDEQRYTGKHEQREREPLVGDFTKRDGSKGTEYR